MSGIGGLVAKEVAIRPCAKEGLITCVGTLPQGKGYRAVRVGGFYGRHKIAENVIGIPEILPALEYIGPETQGIPNIGAAENFLFTQPVALNLIIIPAYPAVIAVVFTVIGKFDEPPNKDLVPVPLPAHFIGSIRQRVVILTINEQPQPLIAEVLSLPNLID
jgi:hypothetical protein